jgi:predicted regulator of Ras-like GTPase activity (Roadblock/LC7/MglB family)
MDQKLRDAQLIYYAEDVERIDGEIDGFLELSGARCALLIDRGGHLVTRRGDNVQGSTDAVAALVAGSFAATRELARLLGEDKFSTLYHQGSRDSIQVNIVGDRALFAMVFDQRTNLGMVRYYAVETVKRLDEILNEAGARKAPPPGVGLDAGFAQGATDALDKLF